MAQLTQDLFFFSDAAARSKYQARAAIEARSVHWGELKLLMAEIALLQFFWQPQQLPKPKIVYVGAAVGHLQLVKQLFPEIELHVYPNTVVGQTTAVPKIIDAIVYAQPFTDQIASEWSGRDDVIFICNIHGQGAKPELQLIDYLDRQRKWYFIIKPRLASLKFSLPYYQPGGPESYKYLQGYCMRQLWNKSFSTETRLIPFGAESKEWNLQQYEEQLFYHNEVTRENTRFLNPFRNDTSSIDPPELLNDYDSVAQAFLLRGYLRSRNQQGVQIEGTEAQVVRLNRWLLDELNGWMSLRTSLDILRQTPGRSTVARQQAIRAGKLVGQAQTRRYGNEDATDD